MSVIRIEKTKNYTVMSNYHLYDKNLSFKAKGLLSYMLALPEDWDYSVAGLCTNNNLDGRTSVESALKELKENGYLIVNKRMPNETKTGRIEYEYVIYEQKQSLEKQGVENQPLEILPIENHEQLNTNKENTNNEILNTNLKEISYNQGEDALTVWDIVKKELVYRISPAGYSCFIKSCEPQYIKGDILYLKAPSNLISNAVKENYLTVIEDVLKFKKSFVRSIKFL